MPKERHVMELQGKTRVFVENRKVVEVGMPQTEYCPIFDKVRGIRKFTPKTAKENVGETFMTGLRKGLLDNHGYRMRRRRHDNHRQSKAVPGHGLAHFRDDRNFANPGADKKDKSCRRHCT